MAMLRGVRCVLFDLDGTLIDSAADLGRAADDMRIARGLPSLPISDYRASAGSGARGMLGVAFGVTPADGGFTVLRNEFFDRYEQRMTMLTQPFDGAEALLQALARHGVPWGVVTNKSSRFVTPLLATMPMFNTASARVCGDTTPPTPSRIPRRCTRPCARSACGLTNACMSATTSATWWQGARPAWRRWPRATAISARARWSSAGRQTRSSTVRLNS